MMMMMTAMTMMMAKDVFILNQFKCKFIFIKNYSLLTFYEKVKKFINPYNDQISPTVHLQDDQLT